MQSITLKMNDKLVGELAQISDVEIFDNKKSVIINQMATSIVSIEAEKQFIVWTKPNGKFDIELHSMDESFEDSKVASSENVGLDFIKRFIIMSL